jgi:excisionase family DNA binding protein
MAKSTDILRDFVRVKQAAEMLGVSGATVRRLCDDNTLKFWRSQEGDTGHRFICKRSLTVLMGEELEEENRLCIGYGRVSTQGQKQQTSLDSQIEQLQSARKKRGVSDDDFLLLAEKMSGISLDRPQLEKLIDLVFAGRVNEVLVCNSDRLSRGSYKTLKKLFSKFGTNIICLNQDELETDEDELMRDVMDAIYCFGSKRYGARSKEKFSYDVPDSTMDKIYAWQDKGMSGREIARKAEKENLRCEKTGNLLTYNWIIRRLRKRQKALLAVRAEKTSWLGSDLHTFFRSCLKRDSAGKAEVGSSLVKRKFEVWAKEKGIAFDKSDHLYWKKMLVQHGIRTYRDEKKSVTYIIGWKFINSRQ